MTRIDLTALLDQWESDTVNPMVTYKEDSARVPKLIAALRAVLALEPFNDPTGEMRCVGYVGQEGLLRSPGWYERERRRWLEDAAA